MISGKISIDTFFNGNLEMLDHLNRLTSEPITNFNALFNDQNRFNRIIIFGDAGCGKSMFAHQMAREWMKGESEWTTNFWFLFIFRLSELKTHHLNSMEQLLSSCLPPKGAKMMSNWLEMSEICSKTIFILDGLDELQHSIAFMDELVSGLGPQLLNVVITSRPGERLEQIRNGTNYFINLRGFNGTGTVEQLQKFNVNLNEIDEDTMNMLKTPLFNTLYAVAQGDQRVRAVNVQTLMDKFIAHLFNRYRSMGNELSHFEEDEVKKELGKVAQSRYSEFIHNLNDNPLYLDSKHLQLSKAIGLMHQHSQWDNNVFPHGNFATYFAAYYWSKEELVIKSQFKNASSLFPYDDERVVFLKPENGFAFSDSLFVSFLNHFNPKFNESLWLNFNGGTVPWFSDVEKLPLKTIFVDDQGFELSFDSKGYTGSDVETLLSRMKFVHKYGTESQSKTIILQNYMITYGRFLKRLSFFHKLKMVGCFISISPKTFFENISNKYLEIQYCKWKSTSNFPISVLSGTSFSRVPAPAGTLETIIINGQRTFASSFEEYAMNMNSGYRDENVMNIIFQNFMKTVHDTFVGSKFGFQSDFPILIPPLNNNSQIATQSNETWLNFDSMNFFEPYFANVKGIHLVDCHWSDLAITALGNSFYADSFPELTELCLKRCPKLVENQLFIETISKLQKLQKLHISDCKMSRECLSILKKVFLNDVLRECCFINETMIGDDKGFLDNLNKCSNLKKVLLNCNYNCDFELD